MDLFISWFKNYFIIENNLFELFDQNQISNVINCTHNLFKEETIAKKKQQYSV